MDQSIDVRMTTRAVAHRTGTAVARRAETPFGSAFRSQIHVLYALMLHDIKSRYFGSGLGYIVTILWPTTHIVVIIVAYTVTGRVAPFGNSNLLFVATGVLPYICWNYISRFCMMGVAQNASYTQYPIVKNLDLIIARIALELVSVSIMTCGMLLILPLFGVDVMPYDIRNAALALFSSILLGIGFGILGAVIVKIFPLFQLVYVLFLIGFWITAGVAINPEAMPFEIGNILAWNPLLHSVEWMRSSYFPDAPIRLLDKTYVISMGFGTMAIGLLAERVLRPFFK